MRTRRTPWIAMVAVVLVGCGSAPPTLEVAQENERDGSGLVWIVDTEGRSKTLWVSTEDGRPLASQPIEGPLWAVGSMLWQWIDEPVDVPLYACVAADEEEGHGALVGHASARRVVLRELTESLEIELVRAPSIEPVHALTHEVRPVASVGPYVFVTEELRVDGCGMHASDQARALVWDLGAASTAEVLTERERDAIALAEARDAAERLAERSDGADDVALAALVPSWDAARGLSLDYLFVSDACYACGDGAFGSYTITERVPAAHLPEELAARARLPRWVRRAMERAPSATLAGFTRVDDPAPLTVLAALRR